MSIVNTLNFIQIFLYTKMLDVPSQVNIDLTLHDAL